MKNLFLFVFIFMSVGLVAQKYPRNFGAISKDELTLKSYSKDPEADALILFDIGKSIFFDVDNGYDIRFTRRKRIKIFNEKGTDHAEIAIPFYVDGYGKTEVVKDIEAYTYYLDGELIKRTPLDPSTIYEEVINQRWRVKKFVFPNVKAGSVLEMRYNLETPFHFNLPDWEFQAKIPTLYSEYTVNMIPFYEYTFLLQGRKEFDYQKSYISDKDRVWGTVAHSKGMKTGNGVEFNDYIHVYALKDVPAFKDESFISSINDYIIKLDFQLAKFHSPYGGTEEIISSWPEMSESLLKHDDFGRYMKKSKKYAKKVLKDEISLTGMGEKEKCRTLIQYVKDNFSWNGEVTKYASKSPKDFFKQKSGNSAEINLFLASLLENAGIPVRPVISSTRSHGKIRVDYPFAHFFNYVVVLVEGEKSFMADATEPYLPFDELPTRCINGNGLVINEDEVKWVKLDVNKLSVEKKQITIEVDPKELEANVFASIFSTDYEAYEKRTDFNDEEEAIKEFYLSRGFGGIERLKTNYYDNPEKPYAISLEGKSEVEKIGNNIILSPFLKLGITENKLTRSKRSYTVDFVYPYQDEYEISVKVPEGYKVTDMPESYKFSNDMAEIILDCVVKDKTIKIKGKYAIKKSVYQPKEYTKIKFYINSMVERFNEEIVFEKI